MSDYREVRTCFDCGQAWDGFGGVCNTCRLIKAQEESNKIAERTYRSSTGGGGGGSADLPAPVNWALGIFLCLVMISNDFAVPKFIWAVLKAVFVFGWKIFSGLFGILL